MGGPPASSASPAWAYFTTFRNISTLALQHQRLIFRAASPLDLRGKENVYLMDEKAQKPPTGKTRYRFVNVLYSPLIAMFPSVIMMIT